MTQPKIIMIFVAAMAVYVAAVFLWPSQMDAEKTARLAGPQQETAFLHERFGVPSPVEAQTSVQ